MLKRYTSSWIGVGVLVAGFGLATESAVAAPPATVHQVVSMLRSGKVAEGLAAFEAGCKGRQRFTFRKNAQAYAAIAPLLTKAKSAELKIAAARTMQYFAPADAVKALSAGLGDGDQTVRSEMASLLGHVGDEAAGKALLGFLDEHQAACAEKSSPADDDCVYALHGLSLTEAQKTGHRAEARAAAEALTMAPSPKVRELSVHVLEVIAAPESAKVLADLIAKEKAGGFEKGADATQKARFAETLKKLKK